MDVLKNLFRIHYSMLISNLLLIVLGIGVLSSFLINFLSYQSSIYFSNFEIIKIYLENSYLFIQMISIVVSMLIFLNSFSDKNDDYHVFLFSQGYSRGSYIITKIITIISIVFIYIIASFESFILMGRLKNRYFKFDFFYMELYLKIFIVAIFYGLVCLLLQQALKSIYALLITFSIYIFSLIVVNLEEGVKKVVGLFLFLIDDFNFVNGLLHTLFSLMVFTFINVEIYKMKDL